VIQRFAPLLVAVAAAVGIACVDMSAPKGAAAISVLQLPSPSVIVGDSMRDSLGVVRPITVIAYDGAGNPIAEAIPQIFLTDSTRAARLTSSAILIGDAIGTARLTGQVEGLQTPGVGIPVTHRPERIVAGTRPDTIRPRAGADSSTSLGSSTVRANVRSAADSVSAGIIVRFRLARGPATSPTATSPVAWLTNESNVPTTRDTTDASGAASIRVVVNARSLEATVAFGRLDSAVVVAESFHNGKQLAGSPLTIVVPIRAVGTP
jgi:hypothetical protein